MPPLDFSDLPPAQVDTGDQAPAAAPPAAPPAAQSPRWSAAMWRPLIEESAARHGIDPDWGQALIEQESGGNPNAVSEANAGGLTQMLPETAQAYGVRNRFVPSQSIDGGFAYLSDLQKRFGNRTEATAAYFAGPDQDNWGPKTAAYVDQIDNRLHRIRLTRGGNQPQPQTPLTFDDLPNAKPPGEGGLSFDDLPNAPGPSKTLRSHEITQDEFDADPPKDVGLYDTLMAARQQVFDQIKQSAQTAVGQTPTKGQAPNIVAAQPVGLSDLLQPGQLTRKLAYQLAVAAPETVGFMGGAAAGAAATANPYAAAAAGGLSAAVIHGATSIGPAYYQELQRTPKDPDGAFDRAFANTGIGSLASGLSFGGFSALAPFKSAVKNILLQATVVQPAIQGGAQAGQNLVEGQPADQGLVEGYIPSVLGAAAPAAGHAALGLFRNLATRIFSGRGPAAPSAPPPGAQADPFNPDWPSDWAAGSAPPKEPPGGPQPGPASGASPQATPQLAATATSGPSPGPASPAATSPETAATPSAAPTAAASPADQATQTLTTIAQGKAPGQMGQGVGPDAPPATPPPPAGAAPRLPAPPALPMLAPPAAPSPSPVIALPDQSNQGQSNQDQAPPDQAALPAPTAGVQPPMPPALRNQGAATTQASPTSMAWPAAVAGDFSFLRPSDLEVDPKRFQYKESDPEKGVTGLLSHATRWEPTLSDPVSVWLDNAGQHWVVNGHQRTDLAKRAEAAGQPDVVVPVRIWREADGYTPDYMLALGAYQNMGQGSGRGIDAAKILRATAKNGPQWEAAGLPPLPELPKGTPLVTQAQALTKLSDEAFGAVVNGVVPATYAAHVGNLISDPNEQVAAIRALAKEQPETPDAARRMVLDMRNAGFLRGTQIDLFGKDNYATSLFGYRSQVLSAAIKALKLNKYVFRAATRGEDTLTNAGNQLDIEGNKRAKTENERLIDHLERNAVVRGPLSDALSRAATDFANGQKLPATVSRFLSEARKDAVRPQTARDEPGATDDGDGSAQSGETGPVEGQDSFLAAPRPLVPASSQPDLFSYQPKPQVPGPVRPAPPMLKPKQGELFGRNDAAIQAQASRDQRGKNPDLPQKPADQGLFAYRPQGQGDLVPQPGAPAPRAPGQPLDPFSRSSLGVFDVQADGGTLAPGRDLTSQVVQHVGQSPHDAARSFVLTRGQETNTEYLTIVDPRIGRVVHAGTNGQLRQVGFNGRTLAGAPADTYTVHHNHPSSSAFSGADIRQLSFRPLGQLLAHGADNTYVVQAGDRIYGRRADEWTSLAGELDALYAAARAVGRDIISSWFHSGNPEARNLETLAGREAADIANRILHIKNVTDYASTYTMLPESARKLRQVLAANGHTPDQIANAMTVYTVNQIMARVESRNPPSTAKGTAVANPTAEVRPGLLANNDRSTQPVRPGGRPDRLLDGVRPSGDQRPGDQERGRAVEVGEGGGSGAESQSGYAGQGPSALEAPGPLIPGSIAKSYSTIVKRLSDGTKTLIDAFDKGLFPLATGSKRAMAIAQEWANTSRAVGFEFKQIDKQILKQFPKPQDRIAMGRAMDEQSVLEQAINDVRDTHGGFPQPAIEQAMRDDWAQRGLGIVKLPPDQRALVEQMARLGDRTWREMQSRGMVNPSSRGLPYYFARNILTVDPEGKIIGTKGGRGNQAGSRNIYGYGDNLQTAPPPRRKYRTPEETLAAAQKALDDPNAFLLQDIRAVPQALQRNMQAVAGADFIDAIRRIGVQEGQNLVFQHEPPPDVDSRDYFTLDGHRAFSRWTPTGYQSMKVAREFEGPIKAVLSERSGAIYKLAAAAKSGQMTGIMWSPLKHLNVELGRAFPLLKDDIWSQNFWINAARASNDPAYMREAIRAGLAPTQTSWLDLPASIADQADLNKPAPGALTRAKDAFHTLHQRILWDTVFKLQVGIYDTMRTKAMQEGMDRVSANYVAAHLANRFAGALPPEALSPWANKIAHMLLFSRSYTLGNLAVMKDVFHPPRPLLAAIEQQVGPQAAKDARAMIRRESRNAVFMDMGLSLAAKGILQLGVAAMGAHQIGLGEGAAKVGATVAAGLLAHNLARPYFGTWGGRAAMALAGVGVGAALGLGGVIQQMYDDWLKEAHGALNRYGRTGNPLDILGVLPQNTNEPGRRDRALIGTTDRDAGLYARPMLGKVGEEQIDWLTGPGSLMENKLNPPVRALVEAIMGYDSLGRPIYKSNRETLGDYAQAAGQALGHILGSMLPLDDMQVGYELAKSMVGKGDTNSTDWKTNLARLGISTSGVATLSKGYPGGPEKGREAAAMRNYEYTKTQALPEARRMVEAGKQDEAAQYLIDQGLKPKDAFSALRSMQPGRSGQYLRRQVLRHLTPEQRDAAGLDQESVFEPAN